MCGEMPTLSPTSGIVINRHVVPWDFTGLANFTSKATTGRPIIRRFDRRTSRLTASKQQIVGLENSVVPTLSANVDRLKFLSQDVLPGIRPHGGPPPEV